MKGLIIRSLSGFYTVKAENGIEYICRPKGVFRHRDLKPLVGDHVEIELDTTEDNKAVLSKIESRKNVLVRPPVANIDQGLVISSLKEPDFSNVLIDKFLLILGLNSIEPIICINKCDLGSVALISEYVNDYRKAGYRVFTFSALKDFEQVFSSDIFKDKVSILTGQSGVGKSSILNMLNPDLNLQTNQISKALNRGKHTTRHTELFHYGGGYIADTPGFSSLELPNDQIGLSTAFKDFSILSNECKFRGCLHESEPGCAVKYAVETGEILKSRYDNYLNFLREMKERKVVY